MTVRGPHQYSEKRGRAALDDDGVSRIVLIDDSTLVHAGLVHTLREHPDLDLVGSARDSASALDACLDPGLDALVVSASCRSIDVTQVIQRMTRYHETGAARMLLLTNDLDDPVCLEASKYGAGGVMLTCEAPSLLICALRIVAKGYRICAPDTGTARGGPHAGAGRHEALKQLTLREREVLQLMARGMKNSEIAAELVLSESTVKTHVQNLLVKLGLHNRASAVAAAYELGITRISR